MTGQATLHTLRVTTTDQNTARVAVRQQQFTVGRPIEFDRLAPRIASIEYALGALGAEAATGLRLFARRRRVVVDEVEALVTGELENELAILEVVGAPGHPGLTHVRVKLFVAAPDHDAVRRVWTDTEPRLPLLRTLRAAAQIDIDLVLTS
jgi:hypothetical protein